MASTAAVLDETKRGAADLVVPFRYCQAELYRAEQLVIVRFADGSEAHACPHETPAYHAHAIEKCGVDDIMLYCWQHEIFHVMHGEMHGRPSVVLWAVAHGLPTDTPECEAEEREAQDLQRVCQMRAPLALVPSASGG